MTEAPTTVFLVDDDAGVLKALARLLRAAGHEVREFSSPREFLAGHDPSVPGCAVFDVAMPELDGLQVQAALTAQAIDRPVIFITGVGNVPVSVRAMKAGAVDFLTKPVNDRELLSAVANGLARDAEARQRIQEMTLIASRLATLTRREREVLSHVVAGRLNKQIAFDLGTVEKTIKVHRARMMRKMGTRSVAELVRLSERAGIGPPVQST